MRDNGHPATPFDDRIRGTRSELAKHKRAFESARDARSRYLAEGERLAAKSKAMGGLDARETAKLEEMKSKYADGVKDYKRADELRMQTGARLVALEAAQVRHLIQVHNIFPARRGLLSPMGAPE